MKVLVTGGSGFIGTNLTHFLFQSGIDFLNIDIVKPKMEVLFNNWRNVNILNFEELQSVFEQYNPTHVVHLAAETKTDPWLTLNDYAVNTRGSQNVVDIVKLSSKIERFVLTSTQFVNQSVIGPKHDEDFAPHTIYGESKIISERYLRNAGLDNCWTIIRPTNVWGPWHLRYPFEFWKILSEGKYLHPGKTKVTRSYGFVGNIVEQIFKILTVEQTKVNRQVLYVGDEPLDLYEWVNTFSLYQTGKKVRIIPRSIVYGLGLVGDILLIINIRFPMTSSRYKSMTTDNPADMSKTFEVLGKPKYSLVQGVASTIDWMKKEHRNLVTIKNGSAKD